MTAAENPFVSDTSSLQSQLKEKEKELLAAKAEVEALRTNEELKDRVFKELRENVRKLEEKLGATENQVDQKVRFCSNTIDHLCEGLMSKH
jgi:predicted  nucleic acid-binding Zn-ribbon protein